MAYKNRTQKSLEDWEESQKPKERLFRFSSCSPGKECEILYVKESELTESQKEVLVNRVITAFNGMPTEVQQRIKERL